MADDDTSKPSFTDLQVKQVASALQNEGHTMSIGGVEQMFSKSSQPISRTTASELLEHILVSNAASSSHYQATFCSWSESKERETTTSVPCTSTYCILAKIQYILFQDGRKFVSPEISNNALCLFVLSYNLLYIL